MFTAMDIVLTTVTHEGFSISAAKALINDVRHLSITQEEVSYEVSLEPAVECDVLEWIRLGPKVT